MGSTTHKTPLRNLRRARTLSQTTLAHLAEISQQSLSRAERGLQPLTKDVQERIATILGATRQEVFPDRVDVEQGAA